MKKSTLLLSLCVAAASSGLTATAAPLSSSQALARLNAGDGMKRMAGDTRRMKLAYTSTGDKTDRASFYIFDKPEEGYMILSADDSLPLLLADIDGGSFNYDALPDNVRWWLGEYNRQIDWFLSEGFSAEATAETPKRAAMKDQRESVAPLVKTQWGQGYPYNMLCPNGGQTGCVATSTAQIVNYHRWPASHGFGQHAYTDRNGQTVSFDFAATEFDWESMADSYSVVTTDKQKQAVATLMKACGVGVDMVYGRTESSATPLHIPYALTTFFGYASCASYILRDTYSAWEWEEAIYQEIACGRPVNYSGHGTAGGHQFVADGYRTDGMFHLNFGWTGISDGYYRLSAIDPEALGTGGGAGGFNYDQGAVVYVCPISKAEGLKSLSCLYIKGQMNVVQENPIKNGIEFEISYDGGGIFANTPVDLNGTFGVIVMDADGNLAGEYEYTYLNFAGADDDGVSGYRSTWASVANLPEGEYQVYPAYRPTGKSWQRVPIYNGNSRYLSLTVDAQGNYKIKAGALKTLPELEATDIVLPDIINRGEASTLTVAFENGDVTYNGKVILYLCGQKGASDTPLCSANLKLNAGHTGSCEFETTFEVSEGDYEIYVADCLQRRISVNFPVKVTDEDAGCISLTADGNETEISYYDLQGRRLTSLPTQSGVYIERKGKDVKKIIVM